MTPLGWFYVAMGGVFFGALVIPTMAAARRTRFEVHRYKFFALRDQLFWLSATGVINEHSRVFRSLSELINIAIRDLKHFTLRSFTAHYQAATSEGAEAGEPDALATDLDSVDPRVIEIVDQFLEEVMKILWGNSLLLRGYVRARSVRSRARFPFMRVLLHGLGNVVRRLFSAWFAVVIAYDATNSRRQNVAEARDREAGAMTPRTATG